MSSESVHHIEGPDCPACNQKLSQVVSGLVDWFKNTVKVKYPNCHVSWGYRDEASQDQAFADGTTRLKWPFSDHNKNPAMAIDLFQIVGDRALWVPSFFFGLDQDIQDQKLPIKWGGRWKSLGDGDHFQWDGT